MSIVKLRRTETVTEDQGTENLRNSGKWGDQTAIRFDKTKQEFYINSHSRNQSDTWNLALEPLNPQKHRKTPMIKKQNIREIHENEEIKRLSDPTNSNRYSTFLSPSTEISPLILEIPALELNFTLSDKQEPKTPIQVSSSSPATELKTDKTRSKRFSKWKIQLQRVWKRRICSQRRGRKHWKWGFFFNRFKSRISKTLEMELLLRERERGGEMGFVGVHE